MEIRAKKIVEIICIYYFLFTLQLRVLEYHLPVPEEERDVLLSVILKHLKMLLFFITVRRRQLNFGEINTGKFICVPSTVPGLDKELTISC